MRITGGTLRSRRLVSADSEKLRPATDRLRETMFDILANMIDLTGSTALDLYAGTGSVGFETISRGAERVVFVESDRKIASVISRNANELGVAARCDIRVMDAGRFVETCGEKFDIAYVDPPYSVNSTTAGIIEKIITGKLIEKGGIICVEHSSGYSPSAKSLVRQKTFGSTILSFITPEEK